MSKNKKPQLNPEALIASDKIDKLTLDEQKSSLESEQESSLESEQAMMLLKETIPWSKDKSHESKRKDEELKSLEQDRALKKQWSRYVAIYLGIFTYFLFITLWTSWWTLIPESALNALIVSGFVKVLGIVWIVVKHLFPDRS